MRASSLRGRLALARAAGGGGGGLVRVVRPGGEARLRRSPAAGRAAAVAAAAHARACGRTWGPAETCRRLACDAGLVPVIEDAAGATLDVGRRSRSIPTAIRRPLRTRDEGCCRFPGCTNSRWLHGHHIEHWVDGGETKLANLVLLCSRHHHHVHELGYRIDRVDGSMRFLDPRGRLVKAEADRPRVRPAMGWLRDRASARDLRIDASTNAPGWDGDRVQHERCVDALANLDDAC